VKTLDKETEGVCDKCSSSMRCRPHRGIGERCDRGVSHLQLGCYSRMSALQVYCRSFIALGADNYITLAMHEEHDACNAKVMGFDSHDKCIS